MVTVPLGDCVTTVAVMLSPFGSKSFPNTLPSTGVLISVPFASSTATGGSLSAPFVSGLTVIITVAISHSLGTPSSHTTYVKESTPVNPGFGV